MNVAASMLRRSEFWIDRALAWANGSHLEDLGVAGLDLVSGLFDAGCILLHQFDLGKGAPPGLLLGLPMHGMLAGKIDQELLGLEAVQPAVEKASGIGIGRLFHDAGGGADQRRALAGVD